MEVKYSEVDKNRNNREMYFY